MQRLQEMPRSWIFNLFYSAAIFLRTAIRSSNHSRQSRSFPSPILCGKLWAYHSSRRQTRALKGVDKALAKRSACCPDEHSSQLTIFYPRTIRDQISENIRGSQVLMAVGSATSEYHAGLPDLGFEQHLSTPNNTIPFAETDPSPY